MCEVYWAAKAVFGKGVCSQSCLLVYFTNWPTSGLRGYLNVEVLSCVAKLVGEQGRLSSKTLSRIHPLHARAVKAGLRLWVLDTWDAYLLLCDTLACV